MRSRRAPSTNKRANAVAPVRTQRRMKLAGEEIRVRPAAATQRARKGLVDGYPRDKSFSYVTQAPVARVPLGSHRGSLIVSESIAERPSRPSNNIIFLISHFRNENAGRFRSAPRVFASLHIANNRAGRSGARFCRIRALSPSSPPPPRASPMRCYWITQSNILRNQYNHPEIKSKCAQRQSSSSEQTRSAEITSASRVRAPGVSN